MPQALSPAALSARIQQLVAERQKHVDALARIEPALEQIRQALGVAIPGAAPAPTAPTPKAPAKSKGKKGRKSQKYVQTGGDSILAFIQEKGNPSTQEIAKHWASEKRGGSSDNVLTDLFKKGVVKRTPLEGRRGSRYTLA